MGPWRQHSALARDDGVGHDQLRLQHELQVGDFAVETMVMIDQPMSVILNPDVVLQRKSHGRPRMRLELWHIDEEVRARYRFWCVKIVTQPPFVPSATC